MLSRVSTLPRSPRADGPLRQPAAAPVGCEDGPVLREPQDAGVSCGWSVAATGGGVRMWRLYPALRADTNPPLQVAE